MEWLRRDDWPSSTNELRISLVPISAGRDPSVSRARQAGGCSEHKVRSEGDAVKAFADLTEQEILALAISPEEEDARIYADYADGLQEDFPGLRQGLHGDGGRGERAPAPADRAAPRRSSASTSRSSAARTCRASSSTSRSGWCARSASTRCASRPRPWSSRRAASTSGRWRATSDAGVRKLLGDLADAERAPHQPRPAARRRASDRQTPGKPRRRDARGACSCCRSCSRASPA